MTYKDILENTTKETQVVVDKALEIFNYIKPTSIKAVVLDSFGIFEEEKEMNEGSKVVLSLLLAILTTDNDVKIVLNNYGINSVFLKKYYELENIPSLKSIDKEYIYYTFFKTKFSDILHINNMFSPLGLTPELIFLSLYNENEDFIKLLLSKNMPYEKQKRIFNFLPRHIKAIELAKIFLLGKTVSDSEETNLNIKSLHYTMVIDTFLNQPYTDCDLYDLYDEYDEYDEYDDFSIYEKSIITLLVTKNPYADEFIKVFNNLPAYKTGIKYEFVPDFLFDKANENKDMYKKYLSVLKEKNKNDNWIMYIGDFYSFFTQQNPSSFHQRLAMAILHKQYPVVGFIDNIKKFKKLDLADKYGFYKDINFDRCDCSPCTLKYNNINRSGLTDDAIIEMIQHLINLNMQSYKEDVFTYNYESITTAISLFNPNVSLKEYQDNYKYLRNLKIPSSIYKQQSNHLTNFVLPDSTSSTNKVLQFKIEGK